MGTKSIEVHYVNWYGNVWCGWMGSVEHHCNIIHLGQISLHIDDLGCQSCVQNMVGLVVYSETCNVSGGPAEFSLFMACWFLFWLFNFQLKSEHCIKGLHGLPWDYYWATIFISNSNSNSNYFISLKEYGNNVIQHLSTEHHCNIIHLGQISLHFNDLGCQSWVQNKAGLVVCSETCNLNWRPAKFFFFHVYDLLIFILAISFSA